MRLIKCAFCFSISAHSMWGTHSTSWAVLRKWCMWNTNAWQGNHAMSCRIILLFRFSYMISGVFLLVYTRGGLDCFLSLNFQANVLITWAYYKVCLEWHRAPDREVSGYKLPILLFFVVKYLTTGTQSVGVACLTQSWGFQQKISEDCGRIGEAAAEQRQLKRIWITTVTNIQHSLYIPAY